MQSIAAVCGPRNRVRQRQAEEHAAGPRRSHAAPVPDRLPRRRALAPPPQPQPRLPLLLSGQRLPQGAPLVVHRALAQDGTDPAHLGLSLHTARHANRVHRLRVGHQRVAQFPVMPLDGVGLNAAEFSSLTVR